MDCVEDARNDSKHAEGARNDRDCTKVTMQKSDCAEGGGMRNFAEEGDVWFRGTINTLRAQRMVLRGREMEPNEQQIVTRKDMNISKDARDSAEEQDTKPRCATKSNNQHLYFSNLTRLNKISYIMNVTKIKLNFAYFSVFIRTIYY